MHFMRIRRNANYSKNVIASIFSSSFLWFAPPIFTHLFTIFIETNLQVISPVALRSPATETTFVGGSALGVGTVEIRRNHIYDNADHSKATLRSLCEAIERNEKHLCCGALTKLTSDTRQYMTFIPPPPSFANVLYDTNYEH